MKSFITIAAIFCALNVLCAANAFAQDSTKSNPGKQHSQYFVDEDGDGYNDNAPDHDGDGVPNGLDPDWQKLKKQKGKKKFRRFIDLDGDGINDNVQMEEEVEENAQKLMQMQMQDNENGSSIENQQQKQQGQKKKKGNGNQ